jgi:hypothetical protein
MFRERGEARTTDTSGGADTTSQVIRLPLLRPDRISRWFMIVEAEFEAARITSDKEKYNAVILSLGWQQLDLIDDVLDNPPPTGLYENLKTELIRRLTDSAERRVQRLLEEQDLGDRTPSQLYRDMRKLATTTIPDELLVTIWKNRLPASMRAILAPSRTNDPKDLMQMADRIHEARQEVNATSTFHTPHTIPEPTQRTASSITHRRRPDCDHQTQQEQTNQHHGTEKIEALYDQGRQRITATRRYEHQPGTTTSIDIQVPKTQDTVKFQEPRRTSRLVLVSPDLPISREKLSASPHLEPGKLQQSPVNAAHGNDDSTSRRIYVKDVSTKTSFLIDTGADVCVYPRSKIQDKPRKDDYELFAVNGTTIATYGTIPLSLNFCLRRNFKWRFIVADVSRPIIGMDFLSHYALLVDPRNRRLIDRTTKFSTRGYAVNPEVDPVSIKTII